MWLDANGCPARDGAVVAARSAVASCPTLASTSANAAAAAAAAVAAATVAATVTAAIAASIVAANAAGTAGGAADTAALWAQKARRDAAAASYRQRLSAARAVQRAWRARRRWVQRTAPE